MPGVSENTAKKMKKFYENHKSDILTGLKILEDEKLLMQIRQAMVEKGYEIYKKKVLYEEALDYASK